MIPTSNSEYIPRDDVTEAIRLKNFGATTGYGETIFEEAEYDDMAQMLSDMVANGQVDMGEGGV